MDRRYLWGVAAFAVTVVLLPAGTPATVIGLALSASCPVAVWIGVRRHQPQAASVWYLLGAGLMTMFVGDLLFRFSAPAYKDILHTVGYLTIVAAALVLLRVRGAGQDREGLLDAAILTAGAAIVMWRFVIDPNIAEAATTPSQVFAIVYPLFDVALFGLIMRLLLSSGTRVRSLWYLIAALSIGLVTDVAGAMHIAGWPLELLGEFARPSAAAAALTVTMREITSAGAPERRHLQRLRLVAVSACLLLFSVFFSADHLNQPGAIRFELVVGPPLLAGLILMRLVHVVRDHERALRQLSRQALYDSLTGLPNRRLLTDRIAVALARGARNRGLVAVLFCDLDNLKHINDRHGHAVGDQVLCKVGERLASMLRPGETLGRLGGDEFVVCCEELATPSAGVAIAQRLVNALAAPLRIDDNLVVGVSVSIGVAVSAEETSTEKLLLDADTAMYAAKDRGRNRVELFRKDLRDDEFEKLDLQQGLRRAIDEGQLRLDYQPIRSLDSDITVGAEALVRWEHPQRGLLPPAAFIAVAERSELINLVGAWVLAEACRQLREWQSHRVPEFTAVSVNISPRQLEDPGFVELVARTLSGHGIEPSAVCLEITETVCMADPVSALRVLQELKELGVGLALDDFGSGYSSLGYLKWLPVDTLKIDRTLIAGLEQDPHARAIVAAATTLGHTLGLAVVAEGIETEDQLRAVADIGCDLAQGYFLGVPAPARAAPAPSEQQQTGALL